MERPTPIIISVHLDSESAWRTAGVWMRAAEWSGLDPQKAVTVGYETTRRLYLVCLTKYGEALLGNAKNHWFIMPVTNITVPTPDDFDARKALNR